VSNRSNIMTTGWDLFPDRNENKVYKIIKYFDNKLCNNIFFAGHNNYQRGIIPYVETFAALDRPANCNTHASQRDELQMSWSV